MAINGSRSKFNIENNYQLDNFIEMFELSAQDAILIQRWKQLKAISNKTEIEEQEYQNLTNKLSNKIVSAEDWNLLLDSMYNLEQAYVDKGLDKIEQSINEYISNYVQTQANKAVQDKINTSIEGAYDTGGIKIIISETPPQVVEGALWIKPKKI